MSSTTDPLDAWGHHAFDVMGGLYDNLPDGGYDVAPGPKHPGACPFCGSEVVNYVQPDILLRDAELRVDAEGPFFVIGESDQSVDFGGPMLFHCHGCSSDYPIPDGLREVFDEGFKADYELRTPSKGEQGYIGHRVTWVALGQHDPARLAADEVMGDIHRLAARIREVGGAVAVFTPDEVGGLETRRIEDAMVTAGNETIEILDPTRIIDDEDDEVGARLEYLRQQLRAECISFGELVELQSLAGEIDPGDVELLEAAGVPEFPDDDHEDNA